MKCTILLLLNYQVLTLSFVNVVVIVVNLVVVIVVNLVVVLVDIALCFTGVRVVSACPIQADKQAGTPPRNSYGQEARHHQRSLGVHQKQSAARSHRERIH